MFSLKICFWLVWPVLCSARSSLLFSVGTRVRESEVLVRKALSNYFPYGGNLGLILSRHVETGNQFTNMLLPVVVLTSDGVSTSRHLPDLQGYVFVTDHQWSLTQQTLAALQSLNTTSPRLRCKRVLIIDICPLKYQYDLHYYYSFLKFLWQEYGLVYVAIYPFREEQGDEFNSKSVFAYNPFIRETHSSLSLVRSRLNEDFAKLFQTRFSNLNGYEITVARVILKKLVKHNSGHIKRTLKQVFNLTVKVQQTTSVIESQLHEGVTYCSPVPDVIAGVVDLTLDPIPINSFTPSLDYLMTKSLASFVIVVDKPPPITWQIFIKAFTWEAWFWIALSSASLCLCTIFMSKLHSKRNGSRRDTTLTLTTMLCALVTKPIRNIPAGFSERLFLSLSLWPGFVITTLLLGQVVNFMNSRPRPPAIDSFQDLVKSGIHVYLPNSLYNMEFLYNSSLSSLGNRMHFGMQKPNGTGIGSIHIEDFVKLSWRLFPQLQDTKHKVSERVIGLPLMYVMPAGNILFEHFNALICKLLQSGFFARWDEDYLRRKGKNDTKRFGDKYKSIIQKNPNKVLSYNDLCLPFYILYIGSVSSLICFLTENYLFHFYKRN